MTLNHTKTNTLEMKKYRKKYCQRIEQILDLSQIDTRDKECLTIEVNKLRNHIYDVKLKITQKLEHEIDKLEKENREKVQIYQNKIVVFIR